MSDEVELRHEPAEHRFAAMIEGGDARAVLDYRELDDRTLEFFHTFTPVSLRGRGVASRLVAFGLDHAREHGYSVVPTCPFVARFIAGNPQYADLVRQAEKPRGP